MIKKEGKEIQLTFGFDTSDGKISFITVKGICRCGYTGEFRKADIVLEMTVPCPICGSVISIKQS